MNKRISIGEVKNAVQEILRQMHLDNFRPDYVVGITRGGLLPAKMISHYLKVPMHTLDISLRDNVQGGPESNLWMPCDAFGAVNPEDVPVVKNRWDATKRKNILIVEDINDSGATLSWIKDDWEASCFPDERNTWNVVWEKNSAGNDSMASPESQGSPCSTNYANRVIQRTSTTSTGAFASARS